MHDGSKHAVEIRGSLADREADFHKRSGERGRLSTRTQIKDAINKILDRKKTAMPKGSQDIARAETSEHISMKVGPGTESKAKAPQVVKTEHEAEG